MARQLNDDPYGTSRRILSFISARYRLLTFAALLAFVVQALLLWAVGDEYRLLVFLIMLFAYNVAGSWFLIWMCIFWVKIEDVLRKFNIIEAVIVPRGDE